MYIFLDLKNHLPRDEVLRKEVTHSKSPASRSMVGSLVRGRTRKRMGAWFLQLSSVYLGTRGRLQTPRSGTKYEKTANN